MRTAYDALDAGTKAEIEDLVCEHSERERSQHQPPPPAVAPPVGRVKLT
jgi:hypothetical protein